MVQQQVSLAKAPENIPTFPKGFHNGRYKRLIAQFRAVVSFQDGQKPTGGNGPLDGVEVMGFEA